MQDAPVLASDQLDGARHAALLALDLHELELVSVGLHSGEPHELLALLATHLANTVEGFENILGLLSRLLAHYFEEGSSKAGPEHRARKGSGVALEQELLQRLRQWLPDGVVDVADELDIIGEGQKVSIVADGLVDLCHGVIRPLLGTEELWVFPGASDGEGAPHLAVELVADEEFHAVVAVMASGDDGVGASLGGDLPLRDLQRWQWGSNRPPTSLTLLGGLLTFTDSVAGDLIFAGSGFIGLGV